MPEGWGQNKSIPDSWKKGNSLPENWGKQSPGAGNIWPSGNSSAAKSKTDQAPGSNFNISEAAHKGAGLLAGAAKKIGGAAKNAAGSAVEYAKSDDAAEKAAFAKEKAGAAFAGLKGKAAALAAQRKKADSSDTPADDVIEDVNDAIDEAHDASDVATDTAGFIGEAAGAESFDELYEKAMNTPDKEATSDDTAYDEEDIPDESSFFDEEESSDEPAFDEEEVPDETAFDEEEASDEPAFDESDETDMGYVSNRAETPVAAALQYPPPVSPAPMQPQPAPRQFSYEEEKKSPLVPILVVALIVLVLAFGILFGVFISQKKEKKDDNSDTAAVVTTTETTVPENVTSYTTAEPDDTEIPTNNAATKPAIQQETVTAPTNQTSKESVDLSGVINSKGAKYVYSYTTDYVLNGGKKAEQRLDLENGWNISAKSFCSAYGLIWYELWDADDGDYYGWVDSEFIDFSLKRIGERYVTTESTGLNLRSQPNSSSPILANIPRNAKINCYESGISGWYIVYYKNEKGYVSSEYVSTKPNGSATEVNGVTLYDCSKYGRINTRGGTLPSITLDYITGGEWQTLRDSLGNGWHIKATRYCNTMGITWYEIEDADDGDYYGWIDGSFIDFE